MVGDGDGGGGGGGQCNIYGNLTSNSTIRKRNAATKACKAQATTSERQKVIIHGQKKKKSQGPPFDIKMEKNGKRSTF